MNICKTLCQCHGAVPVKDGSFIGNGGPTVILAPLVGRSTAEPTSDGRFWGGRNRPERRCWVGKPGHWRPDRSLPHRRPRPHRPREPVCKHQLINWVVLQGLSQVFIRRRIKIESQVGQFRESDATSSLFRLLDERKGSLAQLHLYSSHKSYLHWFLNQYKN